MSVHSGRGVHPRAAHGPVAACGDEFADRTRLELIHRFEVLLVALRACNHAQLLAIGLLGGRKDCPNALRIDRNGLFEEHVTLSVDGRLEVHRPEVGRGRENDDIDFALLEV